MNEPLAASIVQQLTSRLATSALPDAPVRAEPAGREPAVRPRRPRRLRRLTARTLAVTARRLDPAAARAGLAR